MMLPTFQNGGSNLLLSSSPHRPGEGRPPGGERHLHHHPAELLEVRRLPHHPLRDQVQAAAAEELDPLRRPRLLQPQEHHRLQPPPQHLVPAAADVAQRGGPHRGGVHLHDGCGPQRWDMSLCSFLCILTIPYITYLGYLKIIVCRAFVTFIYSFMHRVAIRDEG
ncbi:hypothetical protein AVEN_237202-1 [Araneus ventricosus]|uniref:Uncharacterized protein n=1 Tax=Araneus ventricosus TaxID=182803 RepID=A0A4Y2HYU0_ARAVE|nr:hypothetical protein AVEN_237202-1 [Araneus ventricosus]